MSSWMENWRNIELMAKTPTAQAEEQTTAPAMPIEWWPIERPVPYKRNARKWDATAIQKVAESIKQFGFVQPIVCDKDDVIIIGHRRLAAARYLGMERVPVYVVTDLSPERVRALRIADNKTHEDGVTWDNIALGAEFMDLKISGFDLNLTGFSGAEIAESVFGAFGIGKKKKKESADSGESDGLEFRVIVDCNSEQNQAELLERFKSEGFKCRPLIS